MGSPSGVESEDSNERDNEISILDKLRMASPVGLDFGTIFVVGVIIAFISGACAGSSSTCTCDLQGCWLINPGIGFTIGGILFAIGLIGFIVYGIINYRRLNKTQ